ncbi:MAG: hypothetical protein EDM03_03425 [Porphyrobacter sp. IPPAS B-1204]|nr:MAG: hypothetical protein EDM03_03425 [Porphyrobacter sp. IPPAS B-1204]
MLLAGCQGQAAEEDAAPEAAAAPSASASLDPAILARDAEQKRIWAAACAADETPVFTCTFKDGKRVAVCGAGEGNGRYRFGGATPEIEIDGGQYTSVMYSGGGESQIAFDNGDTRYIVFSRMVRTGFDEDGNNLPAISDGIVIERGGKFLDIKLCEDPDVLPVQTGAANAIWEDEREPFTEETMRADPPGNE